MDEHLAIRLTLHPIRFEVWEDRMSWLYSFEISIRVTDHTKQPTIEVDGTFWVDFKKLLEKRRSFNNYPNDVLSGTASSKTLIQYLRQGPSIVNPWAKQQIAQASVKTTYYLFPSVEICANIPFTESIVFLIENISKIWMENIWNIPQNVRRPQPTDVSPTSSPVW